MGGAVPWNLPQKRNCDALRIKKKGRKKGKYDAAAGREWQKSVKCEQKRHTAASAFRDRAVGICLGAKSTLQAVRVALGAKRRTKKEAVAVTGCARKMLVLLEWLKIDCDLVMQDGKVLEDRRLKDLTRALYLSIWLSLVHNCSYAKFGQMCTHCGALLPQCMHSHTKIQNIRRRYLL